MVGGVGVSRKVDVWVGCYQGGWRRWTRLSFFFGLNALGGVVEWFEGEANAPKSQCPGFRYWRLVLCLRLGTLRSSCRPCEAARGSILANGRRG